MQGKRFLESLQLEGMLSFKSVKLDLEPLTVLIGPNGSGKSNLIDAISLLTAAPSDLRDFFLSHGGALEWPWKGSPRTSLFLETRLNLPIAAVDPVRYNLTLSVSDIGRVSVDEEILVSHDERVWFYVATHGQATTHVQVPHESGGFRRAEQKGPQSDPRQSILSQRQDASVYPEISALAKDLKSARIFRELRTDSESPVRSPQLADLPSDFLSNDAGNLCVVLDELKTLRGVKQRLLENLRLFYERVEDFDTRFVGSGRVQVYLRERGLQPVVPATRLSDGTLRWLCLLAILCHPAPPPLVCLEEPETGLHPDILPTLAELLIDASQRTQLIVTTHSETLVSALSEVPESVVVCEHDDEGTSFRRLEPERLQEWLENYRLGELWRMGEIGGNRW
ncbi:MAG TPA: AAA family ATPase [Thermoanaerobaculia bacterium]